MMGRDDPRHLVTIIPTEKDYIIGRSDWQGKLENYREFLAPRIGKYNRQDPIGQEIYLQEILGHIVSQGGRFLYPYDRANPMGGCVEMHDMRSIKEELRSMLGGLATSSTIGKSPSEERSSA